MAPFANTFKHFDDPTSHRRRTGLPDLTDVLAPDALSRPALASHTRGVGREELGTLGRGNHFLEFQADGEGRLWIMVHSGSRAMGQHITAAHLKRATAGGGGLAWLDADSAAGRAYLRDVEWARQYAAQSRRRMLIAAANLVEQALGLSPLDDTWLNTDHNHVQRERHGAESLWVHRKGANEAAAGMANIIPGSKATHTFHVEGRGEPLSLASSSHGAGRRLSRSAARSKLSRREVDRQHAHIWIDARASRCLAEEAPGAYKDLDAVMRAQRDLVRIIRKVRPVLCHKGV